MEINENKFHEPVSPLLPSANTIWIDALAGVTREWTRIWDHRDLYRGRGYSNFDPSSLLNDQLRDTYMAGWLAIRSAWIAKSTAEEKPPCPSPQNWKNFLLHVVCVRMGLRSPPATKGKPDRRLTPQELITMFGLNLDRLNGPVRLIWDRRVLTSVHNVQAGTLLFSPLVTRQIIWDMNEHNFRRELASLDKVVLVQSGLSKDVLMERQARVTNCFPERSVVMRDIPSEDAGLGAARWQRRLHYVEAFRYLLSSWSGSAAESLAGMDLDDHSTEADVKRVEKVAYPFYCQIFFDHYGRAATIPRQLPA